MAIIHLVVGIAGVLLWCVGIGVFVTIGSSIWGLIEGILILTGHTKTDGKGNPLKD